MLHVSHYNLFMKRKSTYHKYVRLYFTIAYLKVKGERELQMPFKVGDLRFAVMSAV